MQMALINVATASAITSETGKKSSTLDLGLDSIGPLKGKEEFSVKHIVLRSSFRGWLKSTSRRANDGFEALFMTASCTLGVCYVISCDCRCERRSFCHVASYLASLF